MTISSSQDILLLIVVDMGEVIFNSYICECLFVISKFLFHIYVVLSIWGGYFLIPGFIYIVGYGIFSEFSHILLYVPCFVDDNFCVNSQCALYIQCLVWYTIFRPRLSRMSTVIFISGFSMCISILADHFYLQGVVPFLKLYPRYGGPHFYMGSLFR